MKRQSWDFKFMVHLEKNTIMKRATLLFTGAAAEFAVLQPQKFQPLDEDEGDDAPAVENVAAESDDAFRASAAAELVEQVCIGDQADEAAAEEKDHFDDSGDEPQHDTMTAAEKQLEEARKKLEAAKAKAASPTKLDA